MFFEQCPIIFHLRVVRSSSLFSISDKTLLISDSSFCMAFLTDGLPNRQKCLHVLTKKNGQINARKRNTFLPKKMIMGSENPCSNIYLKPSPVSYFKPGIIKLTHYPGFDVRRAILVRRKQQPREIAPFDINDDFDKKAQEKRAQGKGKQWHSQEGVFFVRLTSKKVNKRRLDEIGCE